MFFFKFVILIHCCSGKTDLLAQMSKYDFSPNGTLKSNRTRLVLPLQFSVSDIRSKERYGDIRKVIEMVTEQHILTMVVMILALVRGYRRRHHNPPAPHHIFRYFNNGGGDLVRAVVKSSALCGVSRLPVVDRARRILLNESEFRVLCFAVDEVNLLADQFRGEVQKSSDRGVFTGNMLTAVAHTLQRVGTAVYTGTGLRMKDIEQAISAYGKDIIVAGPAFPPTTFRVAAYVLQSLIDFSALRHGEGSNVVQSLELYMLTGRMRYIESFMRQLMESNTLQDLRDGATLSDVECPQTVFNSAMQHVANGMEEFVKESALPKILENENIRVKEDTMKHLISMALCGVMCVPGKPGDPQDYDSLLVRCGLVQLGDQTAHRSSRRHGSSFSQGSAGQGHYYFVNREPMMQYALAQALLDPVTLNDKSVVDTEEYIWQELVEPGNDAHQNGLELLTWLLLRAMSQDKDLHELIIGSDAELRQYVNETNFVWCDYPTSSSKDRANRASSYDWLEELETKANLSYDNIVKHAYSDLSASDVHVDDMWFHLTRLLHSDPDKAHFAWRTAVNPPQHFGPDIVGCWRHKTETAKVPLLVLAACSTLPRTKQIEGATSGQSSLGILGSKKLAKDSANTVPSNLEQRRAEDHASDHSNAGNSLYGRRALRILVHPNLVLDDQNDDLVSTLAAAYNLSKDVVKTGRGRDCVDNFVLLLNCTTILRAINQRLAPSRSSYIDTFPAMVLRLWQRFLCHLDQLNQSRQSVN